MAVPVLSDEHAERRHLGGGHGLHPGAQVLDADGDRAETVGHQPRLQGGLQRNQQRSQRRGHLRLGHRPLRRRAHRRAQRRELHVHPGRKAGRCGQVRRAEREQLHLELQQPPELGASSPPTEGHDPKASERRTTREHLALAGFGHAGRRTPVLAQPRQATERGPARTWPWTARLLPATSARRRRSSTGPKVTTARRGRKTAVQPGTSVFSAPKRCAPGGSRAPLRRNDRHGGSGTQRRSAWPPTRCCSRTAPKASSSGPRRVGSWPRTQPPAPCST